MRRGTEAIRMRLRIVLFQRRLRGQLPMRFIKTSLASVSLCFALSGAAFAQTTAPTSPQTPPATNGGGMQQDSMKSDNSMSSDSMKKDSSKPTKHKKSTSNSSMSNGSMKSDDSMKAKGSMGNPSSSSSTHL